MSDLGDPDCVSHFVFICYSAEQELLRLGRQVEARDWLRSVLQVDREYKITVIRDASVKMLIKMDVKEEQEAGFSEILYIYIDLYTEPHHTISILVGKIYYIDHKIQIYYIRLRI